MSVSYGFSALWITVNLSNLKCLLVLLLVGISLFTVINQTAFKKIQDPTAMMNPVTIVQFFHITCVTIIDHLLASGKQNRLPRPIFHYYGGVGTNGCSVFPLHDMLYLSKNPNLPNLRN